MAPVFRYMGVNTRKRYDFSLPLINSDGRPVIGGQYSSTTWNGEQVIVCNNDGSVARGTAGPTPKGYPLSASTMPSPWEQAIPTNIGGADTDGPTLPANLPMITGNE